MSTKEQKVKVDADYSLMPVPGHARRNIVPLIAMLGIAAMVIAVRTGDASLTEKFAESQGLSIITGAGMVIGSFVSGGTATPNFARFAKTPKAAVWTTIIAFFLGNSLMFCFGAFSGVYVGGNDIFEVMIALNLTLFAVIVLGLNIWTTNDNALYASGLGFANITGLSSRSLSVANGIIGTLCALWLYNNFVGWLTFLSAAIPPIGGVIIADYLLNHRRYADFSKAQFISVNWIAILSVALGIAAGHYIPGIVPVNAVLGGVFSYILLNPLFNRSLAKSPEVSHAE